MTRKTETLYNGGTYMGYYVEFHMADKCRKTSATEVFLDVYSAKSANQCFVYGMEDFGKRSTETLQNALLSFMAVLPTATGCILAFIMAHKMASKSTTRFLLEYLLSTLPTIITYTVGHRYLYVYNVAFFLFMLALAWRKHIFQLAKERTYEIGTRPTVLTLIRSTSYIGTCIGILAVDFSSFPRKYRKSRRFGASIMDFGIGLFVMIMAMVSRRPIKKNDYLRMAKTVAPLLILGAARTVVITAINYGQDEHEYGVHLNAFFTLGFTKLFGTLISAIARNDNQLVPLAFVVLTLHELTLQLGISDYVMDDNVERTTFLSANREGLSSLPGFVALYLLGIAFSNWLRKKATLSYTELISKLRQMFTISALGWTLVALSAYTVGIARVTCNAGYVLWIISIVETVAVITLLTYDLIVNTALSLPTAFNSSQVEAGGDAEKKLLISEKQEKPVLSTVPIICESINMNGLVFFLLANVLTGIVNIFLQPENRSNLETLIILMIYMLLSTGVAHILLRKGIRIA